MTKQTILAAALILLGGAGALRADWIHSRYDLSLGAYNAPPPYSYNVAYGYGLPFGSYQLYNPFDPYQYPGRGAYYPRESFYPLPPYGQELYYGPRLLFLDRQYAPPPGEIAIPALTAVPGTADNTGAIVEVNVPAKAEVWFDGDKTAQTGSARVFRSPGLKPGTSYLYLVRAKWNEGGRDVEQMQTITIHAGERIQVAFPLARP